MTIIQDQINAIYKKSIYDILDKVCLMLVPLQEELKKGNTSFKDIHLVLRTDARYFSPYESDCSNYRLEFIFLREEKAMGQEYNFIDSGFEYCHSEHGDIEAFSSIFTQNDIDFVNQFQYEQEIRDVHSFICEHVQIENFDGFKVTPENISYSFKHFKGL